MVYNTMCALSPLVELQLDELQAQNKKLETQAISVQHRLTNLQRRQELPERQKTIDTVSARAKMDTQKRVAKEMGESKGASVARQQPKVIGDVANSKRPLLIISKVQLRLRVTRRSATALARYPQKLAKIVCG